MKNKNDEHIVNVLANIIIITILAICLKETISIFKEVSIWQMIATVFGVQIIRAIW